jgi:heme oxygenase (mycobilin-producing)
MSVVRINVLEVPPDMAQTLEERFSARAGEVDRTPGFEAFELLRPTDGSNRYFVYTRWESAEAFDAWMESRAFQRGHAGGEQQGGGEHGERPAPAATGNELLAFDVVLRSHADES